LSEERYPALGFAARREELALEPFIGLRDEERRCTKGAAAILTSVDLMI
jgi:hypothetical protein